MMSEVTGSPALPPRWRLFWTSVPVAAGLTALKLALDELLGFKGFLEFNSDLNVIFTALVFIMGFILAGTIVDFKEAERLPGEIACQLEIMEDFMGPAYSLFEFFLVFIFLLLLACNFRTPVVAAVVTSFLSLTYWYLYRLIRDIDNPFDFGGGHTEVSLQPLERYVVRIEKRLESL